MVGNMGVKLKDIISPEPINFKAMEGRSVAIDAFNTLYQFLSIIRQRDGTPLKDHNDNITSHLSGILYRNSSMIEKDIKPVYVFDGKAPELKQETQEERRQIREESEQKWKEALKRGDIAEARKYAMRSSKLSPYIIDSSKNLLTLMGIPYIEACGEGEAQAAYMVKKGDVWAAASQDYDCLLFGSPRIVRNLAINSNLGNLEYYELKKVLKELNITREQLIDMGILIGTDFNEGKKRVGAKTALKYAKNGKLETVLKEFEKESNQDLEAVKEIFLHPTIKTDYKIRWKKPQDEKIKEFLCGEHGFSESRVENACKRLKNLNSGQKSLEDWF